ncbi:MAG: alpha-galactosidase [Nocardioidaceae bacterium]
MPTPVHLRGGGVSVVLATYDDQLPAVVHWGADLGDLSDQQLQAVVDAGHYRHRSMPEARRYPQPVVPQAADGWAATPGVLGHRHGSGWSARLRTVETTVDEGALRMMGADSAAGLRWSGEWRLDASGVLMCRHTLTNAGESPYDVSSVLVMLPVPAVATELLDLSGRWIHEREPQRHSFVHGVFRREGRHGRTGHDAALLLAAGTPGFAFRGGEVWAVHTAWSGDHVTFAERNADGVGTIGGGELLSPGEIVLEPHESYATPWVYAAWSDRGLDGVTARLHDHVRGRSQHPRSARPVVLNTWEAVYFDHDLERLSALADAAAGIGVERFVLDDGWFRGRRDDTAGLGDWQVDPEVWPGGLTPLIDHVRRLGMDFGLWVEPEMVNADSDVARAQPEWILGTPGRLPPEWRNQQVLDLAQPGAFAHVLGQLDVVLSDNEISYLKWDHNRDLVDARVHAQTLAAYALMDELKRRHPHIEIESCSSGGARVDLAVLARADRVWASDTNDALERQQIQRWTGLLLPPELVGSHVGPARSHTTGRRHDLAFRACTAMFGHFGIEWDITAATPDERRELAEWVSVYRSQRSLLHTGEVVRMDTPDDSVWVHGVVAPDRSAGLFCVVAMRAGPTEPPPMVRLDGLDAQASYAGRLLGPGQGAAPVFELPGSALMASGWRPPPMQPESALLLHLDRVD